MNNSTFERKVSTQPKSEPAKTDESAGSPRYARKIPKTDEYDFSEFSIARYHRMSAVEASQPELEMEKIREFLASKGLTIAEEKATWRKFSIETKDDTANLFDEMVRVLGMKKKQAYEEMFKGWIDRHRAEYEKIRQIQSSKS